MESNAPVKGWGAAAGTGDGAGGGYKTASPLEAKSINTESTSSGVRLMGHVPANASSNILSTQC